MSADEATETAENKPNIMQQLRANPLVPLIFGVAIAVALIAGMFFWTMGPSYSTLYAGLTPADGGKIIAELDKLKVPYQLAANGSTVLVPRGVVDSTRLTLAGQGLPNSAGVGFEIMDKQSFGISQFAEHVNYIRALQGELARSIETLDAVATARVHLAIPQPSVFVREQSEPSASVVLELYRGRSLGKGQVNAITHLVSSAVTRMPLHNITVIDARGDLLSEPGNGAAGFDGNQLEYIARIEQNYRDSIETILAPVVGRDNIRAQVAVNVDFSTGERTEELYTPNQGVAAIRSKQVNMSRQGDNAFIGGVPGALTNRPAADLPSPIITPDNEGTNQNANAGQGAQGNTTGSANNAGDQDLSGSANRSATINYEVDRVIRHIQKETGVVAKISAAVVINYAPQPVEDSETGKTGEIKPMPLPDERMEQITSLVKQAVGFSASRGDSISVVNVPFEEPVETFTDTTPWWQSPQFIAIVINALQWLLIGIVVLLLWFKLIKPLMNRMPQLAGPQLATAQGPAAIGMDTDDDEVLTDAEAERRRKRHKKDSELMESTQELANEDPKLVAMIIKNWMTSNG